MSLSPSPPAAASRPTHQPSRRFELVSPFSPSGDQPRAIQELVEGLERGDRAQTLLGVTGSGKTMTIAHTIARTQRPALIITPNKTLAGQLYNEFKELFPHNAVEFFVSYYDYYQPEAYIPASDTFIEKDSSINDAIDRMRLAATHSLLTRRDVIIIASVSCIYGLGSAEAYYDMLLSIARGARVERDDILRQLVRIQYERTPAELTRGTFRVRGDVIEVFPAYEEAKAVRIQLFGDEVESVQEFDPITGRPIQDLDRAAIYPATHYVITPTQRDDAVKTIQAELTQRVAILRAEGRHAEATRLTERTVRDVEMVVTMGFCHGIENYSRHLSGRAEGDPPPCLLDYFPPDYLLVIDESHVTIPQIGGMYRGDRARKQTLVEYGFRLPSALDNRPLNFEEFEALIRQVIFVSATPAEYEVASSGGVVVEQLIRPTGLLDPVVEVRPALEQVDDALDEIRRVVADGHRVLVTTLTKRMAEDLTEYLTNIGVKARYLHSDIDTLERHAILRDLRLGVFDVLIGINLLREGLDLPEVALVCILDADKEGFLRSRRSLIQTIGRAARNALGRVILYADRATDAITFALDETQRRRDTQAAYNQAHGITPQTVSKPIHDLTAHVPADPNAPAPSPSHDDDALTALPDIEARIASLTDAMRAAARALAFEEAAALRDRLIALQQRALTVF
jgi:excinuclease ABC subunit B